MMLLAPNEFRSGFAQPVHDDSYLPGAIEITHPGAEVALNFLQPSPERL
jgi:hypothetical protein